MHQPVTFVIGIPSYASSIKQGSVPKVLRNLHLPAIIINVFAMLLVLALVPLETILSGANVLSVLAHNVRGSSDHIGCASFEPFPAF
jgi:hypothetical protein